MPAKEGRKIRECFIADPGFAAAVEDFVKREARAVEQERAALAEYAPFKCEGPAPREEKE